VCELGSYVVGATRQAEEHGMSRIDKRRPRRQITSWQPGQEDEYRITLEQIGHEAYRLTTHDGIDVIECHDYTDPDEAQIAYLAAQTGYLVVLGAFTLAPLPKKPSEIVSIEESDEK